MSTGNINPGFNNQDLYPEIKAIILDEIDDETGKPQEHAQMSIVCLLFFMG